MSSVKTLVRSISAAALGVALFATAGCGGSISSSSAPDPLVQFVNAVPDSVALDLLFDDFKEDRLVAIGSGVAYMGSNGTFKEVRAGGHALILKETGDPFELWSQTFDTANDRSYVAVAIGQKAFGTDFEKRPRFITFDIDRTAPNGNKSRLYIVHAFNRAASIDTPAIDFQTPGDNPTYRAADIAYGTVKDLTVDSGTITLQARNRGTDFVYAEAAPTLGAGKIYLAVVSGVEDSVGAQAPRVFFTELRTR